MYHHEVLERCPVRDSWLYKWFHHDQVYFHTFKKSNLGCLLEIWLGSFVGAAAATIPKQQMWLPSVRARWLSIDQFLHFHAHTETRLRPTLGANYLSSNSNLDCDRGVVTGLLRVLVTSRKNIRKLINQSTCKNPKIHHCWMTIFQFSCIQIFCKNHHLKAHFVENFLCIK